MHTEAKAVAKAFSDRVKGKTIVVTGANRQGVGYATLEGFVRTPPSRPDHRSIRLTTK